VDRGEDLTISVVQEVDPLMHPVDIRPGPRSLQGHAQDSALRHEVDSTIPLKERAPRQVKDLLGLTEGELVFERFREREQLAQRHLNEWLHLSLYSLFPVQCTPNLNAYAHGVFVLSS